MTELKTILIVDDMRTNALTLAAMLKSDWNVEIAQDGPTAFRMAAEDQPNLILLDVILPEMDGYEVCRRLKQSEKTKDIPVVFVTAKDDHKDKAFGLKLGALDYITKPLNKTIVKARVRNLLVLQEVHAELALKNAQLKQLAAHDKQTGLYNRRRLDELLAKEIDRAQRYTRPLSVIILDIDKFKTINDTLGHLTGDIVLQETADLLKSSVRSSDLVGRWGGDEFIIICPETALDKGVLLAERIRSNYKKHEFKEAGSLSVSLGVASYRDGNDEEDILSHADVALYEAKGKGRNQVAQEGL